MKQVTFEEVKESFKEALKELGVDNNKIESFIKGDTIVEDLELCLVASLYIENSMIAKYPNWQGFVDKDSINTVWEYNKVAINESIKDELKE